MANTTKITKVAVFKAIAEAYAQNEVSVMVNGEAVDVEAFCQREVELIQNKALKASQKKHVDNSDWAEKVTSALSTGAKTPTELMTLIQAPNTQKVASVVKGMPNVKRTAKGKKVYYSLGQAVGGLIPPFRNY